MNPSLLNLEKEINNKKADIEAWFQQAWKNVTPILTSSVDIRNAGFKIAAIDTNLFPAGYNNINPESYSICIQTIKNTLQERYPHCKKILIIPENHTRNPYYTQSISKLLYFFIEAGYETKLCSLIQNSKLKIHPIQKIEDTIICNQFKADVIILNNDLSEGIPEIFKNITQPIEPSPFLGWTHRSKTLHFTIYNNVCTAFANVIQIDPWQIFPLFSDCSNISFIEKEGMDCLVNKAEILLKQIQEKYHEYDIKQKPYLIIKADAGTYGMAVMTLKDPQALLKLNRKQRLSMSVRKGRQPVNHVIIQEGITTIDAVEKEGKQATAEPVIYLIGNVVIGGFYRIHQKRGFDENLNSPGMLFEAFSIKQSFYPLSVIARLAALAAAKEKVNAL